jgi:pyruvate/2-oxoglutarate dehydrogenase complex dihydrolipoamide acyltransferase (E2) component
LSEPASSRKDVGSDEPMNEMRGEIYRRLMEAQERIAHTLYKRDVSHDDVLAALDAVDEQMSEAQRHDDLYLSALEHYVEALGGRVEVRAVFDEDEILVRRAPEDGSLSELSSPPGSAGTPPCRDGR